MPSSDGVRVSVTTARSPNVIDLVRSAEPSARNHVASDSVWSVDSAVLNPHATVYRPHTSDVVRSDATLINVTDSNAVNVPTPREVIASLSVYPTLANAPTQADVIVLLTHSGAHIDIWSGE